MNFGNIIVIALILLACGFAIRSIVKNKRKGSCSSCSGGCSSCPYAAGCHKAEKDK